MLMLSWGPPHFPLHTAPWDESIRVPFLLRWPRLHGDQGQKLALPLDAPDIMPTLLGLCGLPAVDVVEGRDWSPFVRKEVVPDGDEAALLSVPVSFFNLKRVGMQPHRGLRTIRYTYIRNLDGPWLLYDNESDPYQMRNLVGDPAHRERMTRLDRRLQRRLDELGDEFCDGEVYLKRDGLEHYREVNWPTGEMWRDPWSQGRLGRHRSGPGGGRRSRQ